MFIQIVKCVDGRRLRVAICIVGIAASVSACSPTSCVSGNCTEHEKTKQGVQGKAMNEPASSNIEAVGQIRFEGGKVLATVLSTGCTRATDFSVQHTVRDGRCYLQLMRGKQDFCRAAPFSVEVSLAWEAPSDCKNLPVVFANPVVNLPDRTRKSVVNRQLK